MSRNVFMPDEPEEELEEKEEEVPQEDLRGLFEPAEEGFTTTERAIQANIERGSSK